MHYTGAIESWRHFKYNYEASITGVWGAPLSCPEVQGQSPWSGDQGGKLKHFGLLDVQ